MRHNRRVSRICCRGTHSRLSFNDTFLLLTFRIVMGSSSRTGTHYEPVLLYFWQENLRTVTMNKRDIRLDTMRGILLVVMTLNHLGVMWTRQPFGFVSAAEGFILLSAFTYAITTKFDDASFSSLSRTAATRALRIYKYHVLLFLALLVVVLAVPVYSTYFDKQFFLKSGSEIGTIAGAMLLVHQPMYLDILPMYIVFSLLSPVVLHALRRQQGMLVVLASLTVWGAGQLFNPMDVVADAFGMRGSNGYFNLFSWQLLWVLGLYLGFFYKHPVRGRSELGCGKILLTGATVIVLACLLVRYSVIVLPEQLQSQFNKTHLGLFRFLNAGAQLVLLLAFLRMFHFNDGLPWFRFIGTYSLQVFTYHVLAVYLLKPISAQVFDGTGSATSVAFSLLVVASLSIPALVYREVLRYRAKALRPEAAVPLA